ncbi:Arc family DNA-binding protein [Sinorhizobium meliloti]|nr:Arc family DNA-binding protein [Sinorhizobium meliloti]MDW9732647.1 Arc family DNA-binding protein [Sinorhizobium meliloti]
MAREDLHFRLRIPEGLKRQIEANAKANNRSMTGEIIARLSGANEETLRDKFAGQALVGLMSYPGDETSGNWHNNSSSEGVATRCYELADAMLAARKGGAQ